MSIDVVAGRPATTGEVAVNTPAPPGAAAGRGPALAAVLAPVVAAVAALAVHLLLPNGQAPASGWTKRLPPWMRPYPIALEALLIALPLFATLEWLWQRVRPAAIRAAEPIAARFRACGQWLWEHSAWRRWVRIGVVLWGALFDLIRDLRPWGRRNAPLAAGIVVAFCAWDLVTLKLNWLTLPYFPGPDRVLAALVADRNRLIASTLFSLVLLLSGYAAGVVAGLVCGVLIGWFSRARYWGMPILRIFGPVPATALIPLVITLSSQSFISGAALIAFAVWFPATMLTSSGIANVRVSYLDVARTLGAGRLYLIFRVAVPSALPSVFLGLFMGLGAAFLTLIVAETVGVPDGLGLYLSWAAGYVEFDKVFASILIMVVFFSTLMTLLFKVRDRVLQWQKGVIKW